MSEASPKSGPGTSQATPSVTGSLESAAGPSPSNLPDGLQVELFGPGVLPVSRSAQREGAMVLPTSGTSGRPGSGSSASATLSISLANRLAQRFALVGSMEYQQTWKQKATPSGRPYWEHTASARRTSGRGSTGVDGWRTPNAQIIEAKSSVVKLSGRTASDPQVGLADQVQTVGWPTPVADPANGTPEAFLEQKRKSVAKTGRSMGIVLSDLAMVAQLAGWTTPQAMEPDAQERPSRAATGRTTEYLGRQVLGVGGWGTPTYRDDKDSQGRANVSAKGYLARQVFGMTSPLSPAPTEKRGALNPELPRWLLGFPAMWSSYAPTATRSARRSRRSS